MTNVEEIYDVFLSQIDDEMFALLRPEIIRRELHKYLMGAIVAFKSCKKDLKIDGYVSNEALLQKGISSFDLKDRPKNIEIFSEDLSVEYVEKQDYKVIKDSIIFIEELKEPVILYLYENGYFNDELDYEEIYILALGMVCQWLAPKRNREENLVQMITDSDYKKLSGANMLDKMIKLYDRAKRELELMIINYSYNNFKGFN